MEESSESEWELAQCFGDRVDTDVTEADVISAVEFDETGDYLATGDKGGRVVLFERGSNKNECEYNFYAEFQSHEPEFDYLKSLEIEEKINKICWCKQQNATAHCLITTNDKTIKLWKVFEKAIKVPEEPEPLPEGVQEKGPAPYIRLPKLKVQNSVVTATVKRIYQNAHMYHINSLSVNSDGETFISADDLRINLWNLNVSDKSFNIVDIKPKNMEELTEVITSAEFHPSQCNLFIFGSSKGTIRLNDMRQGALCDNYLKLFEAGNDAQSKSFFSEIVTSISGIKFSRDGQHIFSRDYLTLKVWDVKMEKSPLRVIKVHEQVKSKLCDLYENDSIFDKFECAASGDGKRLLTGSYGNCFYIFGIRGDSSLALQADKDVIRSKDMAQKMGQDIRGTNRKFTKCDDFSLNDASFAKKILHVSWHPLDNIIALAASNNLFMFKS